MSVWSYCVKLCKSNKIDPLWFHLFQSNIGVWGQCLAYLWLKISYWSCFYLTFSSFQKLFSGPVFKNLIISLLLMLCQWLLAYHYSHSLSALGLSNFALVCTWMGDRCGMSISADSPLDETLNRGPLALLLRRQYEFPFGINIVQFSFFFSMLLT